MPTPFGGMIRIVVDRYSGTGRPFLNSASMKNARKPLSSLFRYSAFPSVTRSVCDRHDDFRRSGLSLVVVHTRIASGCGSAVAARDTTLDPSVNFHSKSGIGIPPA